MKILFTNSPFYGTGWHGVKSGCRWPFIFDSELPEENSLIGYNTMPFFMAYAASYLTARKVGDVFFYDALALKHRYETFYKTISDINADITIIETSTPSIDIDLKVARKIKEMGSEVALCGPHATIFAESLITLPEVDYVLQGEYEANSYEMCLMRRKGIYKCKPMENLDYLVPFRSEVCYYYADGFGQDKHIQFPQLQMWTSRGCPYKCNFCLWKDTMTFNNYRPIAIRSLMRELTSVMKEYNFKSVLFDDDTVNVGDKRTIDLSEAMSNIDIQWHAMVRADSCSWTAFEKMRKSGCEGLKIGIETFSQQGLDYLNKGYKSAEIIKTIDFLINLGFKCFLSFMDNIPGETEDDKKLTNDLKQGFIERGASIQHPNCMPLPGTELYNRMKADLSDDWFEYGKYHGEVLKQ